MNRIPALLLAALTCLLISPTSFANHGTVVEARLPSGKVAGADFHEGKKDRPAVLIVHGFLQTRAFPTIDSMVETLAEAGYTVMAPTLSLGISGRNKSLPCEAVHLHTLDEDAEEIAFWVRWLTRHGHSQVILIGHSFGNVQMLASLKRAPLPAVKQLLMISLVDVEAKQSTQQRALLVRALRDRVMRGDRSLVEVEFGHCKKYVSPPAALLSYLEISRSGILDSLVKSQVPIQVIMGGKDDRMGADWVGKLASRGIAVQTVPGASHFFDNQYEFDLQDVVLGSLRGR